jgi:hypothetical protein
MHFPFPEIHSFHLGEKIEEYTGDLNVSGMSEYVKRTAAKYGGSGAPSQIKDHPSDMKENKKDPAPQVLKDRMAVEDQVEKVPEEHKLAAASHPGDELAKYNEFQKMLDSIKFDGLGKHGRVVDLVTDNFEEVTSKGGPWLVEFYGTRMECAAILKCSLMQRCILDPY